ncbi:MAG TPA: sigma-70 family RNA polymerase sigma factor [Acidobacteriaceae bacterium]|jgi:RNA polymerase sigma-70 factor (ECF subfamily)|nr:sigma-70 family RNA polymerase sigma factor [Acidobacteriaceae bacterium]
MTHTVPTTGDSPVRDTTAGLAEQHRRFLEFLRKRIDDAATAEDILQAAYLKALERGAQLRARESSVAWFYRILRNAIVDHYRQQAARARAMNQWAATWEEGYESEVRQEVCACIQEAVRALKPEYRAAIEQVDLGGQSVEAFAQTERTTANNASVRLHRARKAVAKQITAICGTCATHKCVDCTCRR